MRRQGPEHARRAQRQGDVADLRAGPRRAPARNMRRRAPASSPTISARRSADADLVFLAVGTPMRRGDGHADLSYVFRGGRRARAASRGLHRHRHQIDGAGRHEPRDRTAAQAAPARRRLCRLLQSGVPARRLGHPRLHASRPRAGRLRRRARPRGDGAPLQAARACAMRR